MAVSFHVGILPNRPISDFVDWVALADELGFGGVWVADPQSVCQWAYSFPSGLAVLHDANRHR